MQGITCISTSATQIYVHTTESLSSHQINPGTSEALTASGPGSWGWPCFLCQQHATSRQTSKQQGPACLMRSTAARQGCLVPHSLHVQDLPRPSFAHAHAPRVRCNCNMCAASVTIPFVNRRTHKHTFCPSCPLSSPPSHSLQPVFLGSPDHAASHLHAPLRPQDYHHRSA